MSLLITLTNAITSRNVIIIVLISTPGSSSAPSQVKLWHVDPEQKQGFIRQKVPLTDHVSTLALTAQVRLETRKSENQCLSRPSITVTYISGQTLGAYLRQMENETQRSMKERTAHFKQFLDIMISLWEHVDFLHNMDIVHNDLHPDNIIIGYGTIYLSCY